MRKTGLTLNGGTPSRALILQDINIGVFNGKPFINKAFQLDAHQNQSCRELGGRDECRFRQG